MTFSWASEGTMSSLTLASFTLNPLSNPFTLNQGICSALVKQAFLSQNATVQVAYYSFVESLKETLNKLAIGVFPIYKTDKLSQNLLLSDPLYTMKIRLYHKRVSLYAEQLEGSTASSETHKACVSSEFEKLPILSDISQKYNVEMVHEPYVQRCYAQLNQGRVDFLIDEASNFNCLSSSVFVDFSNIEAIPNVEYDVPVYFAVDSSIEGSDVLMNSFNQGLKTLHESGKIQAIIQEYNNYYHIT
jgi:hypothetical protein